jgi:hypothetical protein
MINKSGMLFIRLFGDHCCLALFTAVLFILSSCYFAVFVADGNFTFPVAVTG